MFKQWVDECYPGTKLALGEYNWGGEKDVSGGIAEAELLGIFAREGLDRAYLWFSPAPNGPLWFAFKMYRNPDGKFSAFGGPLPAGHRVGPRTTSPSTPPRTARAACSASSSSTSAPPRTPS